MTEHPEGRIEFYADNAGETRWRAIAANGETIADSSEGYTRAEDARHGLDVLADLLNAPRGTILRNLMTGTSVHVNVGSR